MEYWDRLFFQDMVYPAGRSFDLATTALQRGINYRTLDWRRVHIDSMLRCSHGNPNDLGPLFRKV